MADHTYSGPGTRIYTESRDLSGRHIGQVERGDIRDTDGPLDHMWREATDEDRTALAARDQGGPDAGGGEDRGGDDAAPSAADELAAPDGDGTPQAARTGRKRTQPDGTTTTPDA